MRKGGNCRRSRESLLFRFFSCVCALICERRSARDVDSEKAPSDSESEERSEFDHSVGVQEDEGESSGDDPLQGDIRSIRSFGSMMSGEAMRDRKARMSISDRLAAKLNQVSKRNAM